MTTSLIAVDLAAKYSAACHLDTTTGAIIEQWDSWGATGNEFLLHVTEPFRYDGTAPQLLVVEDLPFRLPFTVTVRDVCRLQGRLIDRMGRLGHGDRLVFVTPSTWRRAFTGLERGTGPHAVTEVAAGLGYTAPDLSERASVRGGKATARKVATDYCAAYLIARYAAAQLVDREPVHA